MPSYYRAFAVALLLTGALANPTSSSIHIPAGIQARDDVQTLNPKGAQRHQLNYVLTNGQRLARGLPLNKPHSRRQDRHPRPSAVAPARPGPTGEACRSLNGLVRVTSSSPATDGRPNLNGFLSSQANEFGEYGYTTDRVQALRVSVDPCNGSPFDLVSSNGLSNFPFVGATRGYSANSPNLAFGSFNYAYIAGVTQTAPRAPPQSIPNAFSATTEVDEASESAIWSFRSGSTLNPQWINTDGATPSNALVYVLSENVFVLTGEVQRFEETFENVANSTFTFESV